MVYGAEEAQASSKASPRGLRSQEFFVGAGKESSTSVGDGVACLADN
jgi:hypothetical protein